jgi:subfamily B ATP-binding cassette protein MsbA
MNAARSTDFRILSVAGRRWRFELCTILVLSVLAFVFDGISIGMLGPLLAVLQKVDSAGIGSAPGPWLEQAVAFVSEERRMHVLLGLIIVAVTVKNVAYYLAIRSGHRFSSQLVANVRTAQVQRLFSAGLELHERSKPADLLDRVVRNNFELELLIRYSIEFIANAMALAALVVLLFMLSFRLAILAVGLGALSVLFGLVYASCLSRLGAAQMRAADALSVGLHESLSAMKLIKSWSTEDRHVEQLDRDIKSLALASFRRSLYSFAIHPITDITATVLLAVIVLASIWLHGGDGRLTLAGTLPFSFVLLRMVPLLKILNEQKALIVSRWPYLRSVAELVRADVGSTIRDGTERFRGLTREIRLHNVRFKYHGRPNSEFSTVDLVIPAGKMTAIIGESGSGKSTLVNLILRLYDPQSGTITIDGRPLTSFRLESYHRRVGSVGQDTCLFNQSVRFNIAYSAASPPSQERVVAAAKQACAHDFITELPDGYDTLIGDRGVQLSGGQRQRLALARAIVADPDILILDEATSALDNDTESAIKQALTEFGQGRTVIVVAHRLSTIRDADQVVVLKNGRVIDVRSTASQRALMH